MQDAAQAAGGGGNKDDKIMIMKRIALISVLAFAVLSAVSCERERFPQTGNGGDDNGNGGGNNPSEVTYTYNNIPSADVIYVSTVYDENKALYDVYDIVLTSDGVTYDDNYNFSGVGAAVVIEVNTTTNEGKVLRLDGGKYPVSGNYESDAMCTYPGEESGGSMYPTYIYYCPKGSASGDYYLVTDTKSSLNVSPNDDGSYNLNATFRTDVAQFVFNYNGTPMLYYVESCNYPPVAGTPGDRSTYKKVEVKDYNAGAQIYYGCTYDIKTSGYSKWDVQLYAEDSSEEDGWLRLELCSAEVSAETELPAGKYECRTPGKFSEETLVPFSLVPGEYEYDSTYGDTYYSTWYFDADHPYDEYGRYYSYAITDGVADVSVASDGTYEIAYTLYDDTDCYTITGTSVVKNLSYYDESSSSEDEIAATSLQLQMRKLSRPMLRKKFSSKSGVAAERRTRTARNVSGRRSALR